MITSEQIERYKLNIAHLSNNSNDFLILKVKELINKVIVDSITNQMQFHEFHQKIWMNTDVRDVKINGEFITAVIHNEYYSDSGFDVAIARERGTKDHMIKPKLKLLLSWISQGKRMFSKGHMVSGIKSLFIIKNTISANTPIVQEMLQQEFEKWQGQVFND